MSIGLHADICRWHYCHWQQFFHSLITSLNCVFSLKDLGSLDYFLGIEVKPQADGSLYLTQGKYLRDLLSKTNMLSVKPLPTPMVPTCKLTKIGSEPVTDATFYRSVVGALQYATITKLDITFAVNKVCQFMANPLEAHWAAITRILRYLKGTASWDIILNCLLVIKYFSSCEAYSITIINGSLVCYLVHKHFIVMYINREHLQQQ